MENRIRPERRRGVRRRVDLTEIKIKLATGLTIVAAASFALGYLSGSGKLDKLNRASSPAIVEASK